MKENLLSVGIDLGTSTTQLIFSKLTLENTASAYTIPRVTITEKEILYRSRIVFTPLLGENRIDFPKVREILEQEYERAGIRKDQVDTGAVIITGETAGKENAREVVNALSGFAGDFVVAAAGPDLESVISGKGAGTDVYSRKHRLTAVNMDIGGGTSNLAVFSRGDTREVSCLDIGGRLVRIDRESRRITYLAPKLQKLMEPEGWKLAVGMRADREKLRLLLRKMAEVLEQSVGLRSDCRGYETMITSQELRETGDIACISFSGGVADAIYHPEKFPDPFVFGDIGILLGEAIRESELFRRFRVIESQETIRATVVGAGSHTTKISGSTITYTQNRFPIKNLPVLKLTREEEKPGKLKAAIQKKMEWFRLEGEASLTALALEGEENPSFGRVRQYAGEILDGMRSMQNPGFPLVIVVEQDMGKVLGQTLSCLLDGEREVVCLDGIRLSEGEYIDIGKPAAGGQVLPVVVKTLVFHS
ncbi:MAG: ethanolamine ammonia-lyase reactivating factor EutA [Candidatus Limivivens sp.]|nr:ethanolamine ammonia-lyase reactivating factor EutA [Candidatus Limivivens sp.]